MENRRLSTLLEKMNIDHDNLTNILIALDSAFIITITDNEGIIKYVNDKFCQVSKYNCEELIGENHRIVSSGYHDKLFFKTMYKTIGSGMVWQGVIKNKAKDGNLYWVQTTIVPFLDDNNKPYQYVSFRLDITDSKRMEELAYYDGITDLPNRNYLHLYLNSIVTNKDKPFFVFFIDLDGFKKINDSYGHDIGDKFLVEVASGLKRVCQKNNNFVSRLGGDEFIIVLQGCTKHDASQTATRIIEELNTPISFNGNEVVVSPSVGISLYPDDSENPQELIKYADKAMYYIKRNGKNNYQFFQDIYKICT